VANCSQKVLRACLKIPESGWVVFDQPQHASNSRRVEVLAMRCGWSSTQPRSFFRQALSEPRGESFLASAVIILLAWFLGLPARAATVGLSLAPVPSPQITPGAGGQFQISWPAAATGCVLEKAANLTPPVVWSQTSDAVIATNGQNVVTINNADSAAVYRLRQ
jgi:hypothetical protein